MSSDSQPQSGRSTPDSASQDLLLDLNFVPAWARGPSGKNPYADQDFAPSRDRREGGRRSDRRPPRTGGRDRRQSGPRGPADRDRGRSRDQGRPARPQGRGDGPAPGRDDARGGPRDRRQQSQQGDRGRGRDSDRGDQRPRHEHHARPAVEVRFLPDRQKLGAMVKEMQEHQKAYPIMELASLFIQKPDHYLVKVETHEPKQGESAVKLYQFVPTQAAFSSRDRLAHYALAHHLDDYFEVEEIEGAPPTGNFQCVCRCGLTGTLLGPPNYHGTQARIQQMVTTRFARMGMDEYRSRVETVRDPDLVEQWKTESRTKKVYRLKSAEPPPKDAEAAAPAAVHPAEGASDSAPSDATPSDSAAPPRQDGFADAEPRDPSVAAEESPAPMDSAPHEEPSSDSVPDAHAAGEPEAADPSPPPPRERMDDAPTMTLEEAKQYFLDHILPGLVRESKRAVMPATVAQRLDDPALRWVIRDAWQRENRFPLSLSLAMRPAFKHMRLHLFKVNRKQVFVTAVPPRPLDADAAIDAIQRELQFMQEHPGCTRQQLVDALCPGEPLDSPKIAEVVRNLRWLIDKGHVIEFYNGRLSLPSAKGAGPKPEPAPKPETRTPADPAGRHAEDANQNANKAEPMPTPPAPDPDADPPPRPNRKQSGDESPQST